MSKKEKLIDEILELKKKIHKLEKRFYNKENLMKLSVSILTGILTDLEVDDYWLSEGLNKNE